MQENITTKIQEDSINDTVDTRVPKMFFKVTMLLFVISSLSAFVFAPGVYLWYIAAIASIVFPIAFLIYGAINFKKGGSNVMGFAVLFFFAALIVGAGTCFVNMGGVGL